MSATEVRGAYSGNRLVLEPSGRVVRKIYARPEHHRAEGAALRMLTGSGLPVPALLGEGLEGARPYLDLGRLLGATPSRPMRADALGLALCKAFGALVRELHDVTRGRPVPKGIPVRTVGGVLEMLPGMPPGVDVLALRRYLEVHREEVDAAPSAWCLLHRDLRFDNLLWDDPAGRLSLIDFEVCAMGRAEGDLSRVLLFELEPPLRAPFLEGYGLTGNHGMEQLRVLDVMFAIEMITHLRSRDSLRTEEHVLMRELILRLEIE